MKRLYIISLFTMTLCQVSAQETQVWMDSLGFVYLDEVLTHAIYDVRYASDHNFVGKKIEGYHTDRIVITASAAKALKSVEDRLYKLGYGLKIFDTYRPQTAVNHFIDWAKDPADTLTKQEFYPEKDKKNLFQLGYISTRSGHSRGSTIDLTLYHIRDNKEIDMGSPYDFFGEISHHDYSKVTKTQLKNRFFLKTMMYDGGFRSYSKEWWHYTLRGEPYPKTFFDCIVHPD